jgi:hypothetical protein
MIVASGACRSCPKPWRSAHGDHAAGRRGTGQSSFSTAATVVAQIRATTSTSTSTSSSTATPAADAPARTTITADEAGSRAVVHLGGGTVTKIEGETEHGRAVWEVDVRRGTRVTEVHVDTTTGAVTRVKDDSRSGDDPGRDDRGRDDRGRDDRGRHGGDDRSDDHGGRGGDDRGSDR